MRSALFTFLFLVFAIAGHAQSVRYADSIFAGYTITTVTYSTVYNQQMDIYQPVGDTATRRPVLVLAHGGSFTSGDRTDDNVITQLCADFAHKGYVTVSIDYRLTSIFELGNSDSAIIEVLRAVSDGKAAVRYMYEYADSFKIDTSNIFIGGNSAGSVLFMQYAYIDSVSELNTTYQELLAQIGGLQGNSGNPGYPTNFKAVINLAGALGEASWLGYCSKPVVSAQGTADPVVPYDCGLPYGVIPDTLCGLGTLQPYIANNTPYWSSMIFPGAGHVPWQSNDTDFYMIDTMITHFLYRALSTSDTVPCTGRPYPFTNTGISSIQTHDGISIYPNPAISMINIASTEPIASVALYDATGREVATAADINSRNYQVNTIHVSAGIYFLSVHYVLSSRALIEKVVIE